MKIESRPLKDIRPYERNPRLNDSAVDAVARSIQEFGFRQPIVVDTNSVIVCGHTRWKAAKKLGLKKVPVHVARDLTAEQAKAYRIADNKSADLATWDLDLLPIELLELRDLDFDLDLLGFGADELSQLLGDDVKEGLTDPDDIPDPPDEAITQRGELIILGSHRLLCGDSSSPGDVDLLLDGKQVHLVNTDPPYNVRVEPRSKNAIAAGLSSFAAHDNPAARQLKNDQVNAAFTASLQRRTKVLDAKGMHHSGFDEARRSKKTKASNGKKPRSTTHKKSKMRAKDRPLENDFVSDEAFAAMLLAWFGNIRRVLSPGRAFYIWGGYSNIANYPSALKASELYFSQMVIWHKQHPVLTRKDFLGDHEWCFYGWREGAAHVFLGPKNIPDVWSIKKVSPQSMIHLTEKPVELAIRAMKYSSRDGENVLDLFGGSGSTLIAAEQTGRNAFLMELDPLYCDVIIKRWEEFTGKKVERIPATDKTPTAAGVEGG